MRKKSKKILCIEDDSETAALIVEELEDRGFEVAVAYSGQEGLLAIMNDPPDLILCDIGMPIMTGFDVLERLNELAPRIGHIPFIFLTALGDRESELKGRRLGSDDYVTKPIDFDRLVLIIYARIAGGVARTMVLPEVDALSSREIYVLSAIARGKTSAEIGRELQLSKRTVDFHIDSAKLKLGATSRVEAILKAVAVGFIKP